MKLRCIMLPLSLIPIAASVALLLTSQANAGQQRAVVIPALIGLLSDPEEEVRRSGASALSKFGPDGAEAVPALQELLNDPARIVRWTATNALMKIVGEKVSEQGSP